MLKSYLMNFVRWLHQTVRSAWFWITIWVVLVVAAASVISIMYWDWLSIRESNGSTIRNVVLAAAAVIALPLAIWRSIVAEKQAETAQRSLLNERYQKGAEMLGSKVLSVRLGGIYALSRLAREHPRDYHTQIMSLLCAFVRNPPEIENQDTNRVGEDAQAIMPALCVRSAGQIEMEKKAYHFELDLSGANLQGTSFLRTASLGNSGLQPAPGPATANLEGADLHGANLSNVALVSANLKGVHLARADLEGAHLVGANLKDANLKGADLSGAVLMNCKDLTQKQLDHAKADSDNPPDLTDAVDAETGKPLVWRGRIITERGDRK